MDEENGKAMLAALDFLKAIDGIVPSTDGVRHDAPARRVTVTAAGTAPAAPASKPVVVIARKDKRQKPVQSAVWAAVTGGVSLPFSAVRAGQRAAYNRRTERLARR